ncbi:hypothetical protein IWQ61_001283 [Dispira simplex]|nr:hypothetical protein IWQ61_001283 [Dispira simplex]
MDQRYAYGFIAREIQHYDTGRIVPESNVTAIAQILLDCAGKNMLNGYVRLNEAIVRHLNTSISRDDEGNNRRPDMVVYQREVIVNGELLHVYQDGGGRKVLVIECKSDHNFNDGAEEQICDYMDLTDFPVGLLLSQRRASFFFRANDDWERIQRGPEFSDISQCVPQIVEIIEDL